MKIYLSVARIFHASTTMRLNAPRNIKQLLCRLYHSEIRNGRGKFRLSGARSAENSANFFVFVCGRAEKSARFYTSCSHVKSAYVCS